MLLACVCLVSCASKEERLVKKFLEDNSNDGKVEIVKCEIEEYIHEVYDIEELSKAQDSLFDESRSLIHNAIMIGQDVSVIKEDLDRYDAGIDSLHEKIMNAKPKEYPMKVAYVKARAKNAMGAMEIDDYEVFFCNDLTKVSFEPEDCK